MPIILLNSKLRIPPVRSEQVLRPRLFKRLDESLGRKLTLVSAPAGFGKTTLISSWAKKHAIPTAWLSLDKDDNDPARFWSYLVAALQTGGIGIAEDSLTMPGANYSPTGSFIPALLNEIEAVQNDFVLVLDDYHCIDNIQVQQGMLFLLDHLMQTMHLIVSTRIDPPWPLARWRASNEMGELRIGDLRFTLDETTQFLNGIMDLDLSAQDVQALEARTEGWIASLHMSGLSIQGRHDKSRFIREFTGSHRFILDYLVNEVIERQPVEIQEFLLLTSILDRLSAPLCDAVTGSHNSQNILLALEKANLFLMPLDEDRRWYRYHNLFADVLQSSLKQRWPGRVRELHQHAGGWYAENGMVVDAVNHAFLAGGLEQVAKLIEENALIIAIIHSDQLPALVDWFSALPKDFSRSKPWLIVAHAWVLAYSGELDAAELVIQESEQMLQVMSAAAGSLDQEVDWQRLSGHIAAIRGYRAYMKGDVAGAEEWMKKALDHLPGGDTTARIFSALILGVAVAMGGDLVGGIEVLSEAASLCLEIKNDHLTVMMLSELAALQLLQGHLMQVAATCEQVLQISAGCARMTGRQLPVAAFAYARLSCVLREQNNLQAALRTAQEALSISRNWGQKDSMSISYLYLAQALQAAGRTEEALDNINKSRRVAISLSPSEDAIVAAHEAKLHYLQGDQTFILKWAHASGLSARDVLPFRRIREYVVFARALMVQGKLDQSLALLLRLMRAAETVGSLVFAIETLILQAMVLQAQGKMESALAPLERALHLAEPERYVRIFVDEGLGLKELLYYAAARGILVDYVHELLIAMGETIASREESQKAPSTSGMPRLQSGLVAALTRREMDILTRLETGLSILEISQQLYISISTLRTHVKNIYKKLGVHSRAKAVVRARELGLL